jgi:uncharacterized protein YjbI with pentapeptide repeats
VPGQATTIWLTTLVPAGATTICAADGIFLAAPGVAVLVLFGWFWWKCVPELYRNPDGTVDNTAVSTTRTGLLALGIGVGAVGTMLINGRNLRVTTQTFQLTQRGQLHDRFTKANEQLGDESIAVRLGGIYALKQLAEDTERRSDQAAVVEVLSAFVRMNFEIELDEPDEERDEYDPVLAKRGEPKTDVLAAISVLAQLPDRDMMRADFTGVDFSAADLTGARLRDGNLGGVSLRKAGLAGAELCEVDLRKADLGLAHLMGTDFENADLRGTVLRRAYLSDAKFANADLRDAKIIRVIMPRANFTGADLRGANLYDGRLADGDLRGARVDGANFDELTVVGTDISGVDLRKVRGLKQYQIDRAKGDTRTKLPDGLKRPTAWTTVAAPRGGDDASA